jgi:alkanesulfonate monooxygenase SsuD/methylene tetrahydromethanopterin reductase-like flavin-dependent oxidoreductase (luciferase family)
MRFGVGLWTLQATASAPRHPARPYRELLDDARHAESLGYEALWLSEHHFFYDGYCPALLTAASAALSVTTRLRLGTGMLLLPYQDPARVTTAARELGRRSGGRLDLGVGLGYRDVEFDGKEVRRVDRVRRHLEGLDQLAAGAETDYELWMGAQSEVGVRRAGRLGHGILLSGALPLPYVEHLAASHREAWEQAGRPGTAKPPVAALRNLWISDDPDERAAVLDWQRASYVLYQGLGWAVAASDENPEMDFMAHAEQAIQIAVDTTIIGSAAEVVDGLRAVDAAGVDYVVLRISVEGAPQIAVHDVMRSVAEAAFPELASAGRA